MKLNVAQSERCPLHMIKMSYRLRRKFGLDLGDWLLFNTKSGVVSLMLAPYNTKDSVEFNESKAVVNSDCPILYEGEGGEVLVREHKLTIGADVEFFMVDRKNNNVIEGYTVFDKEGELGSDGDLGEIRPDYSLSPEQVTENIHNIIKTIPVRMPKGLKAIASSYHRGRCCGFHMHFGLPVELLSFAAEKTDSFMKNVIHTLDYIVGVIAHSLDSDDKRRLSNSYGKPGDYRISMRTLEYRTPGGYHLKTKKHTNSMLCLGFLIVDTIIKESEKVSGGWVDMEAVTNFDYFREMFNIPEYDKVYNILMSKDKDVLIKEREKVVQILANMDSDSIHQIVLSEATNEDLIEGWSQ
jgi:hypothetical protein